MKLYIVIFLLGFVTMAMSYECNWSGCEGALINGQSICNQYGLGTYTGQTDKTGCTWDTARVVCCKATQACEWTRICYSTAYGGAYACQSEFGGTHQFRGNYKVCHSIGSQFECCR